MKELKIAVLGILIAAALSGCSGGGDTPKGPAPTITQTSMDVGAMAQRTNGNYDQLTPDEKKEVLKLSPRGDEKAARTLFKRLAMPEPTHRAPGPGAAGMGGPPPGAAAGGPAPAPPPTGQ